MMRNLRAGLVGNDRFIQRCKEMMEEQEAEERVPKYIVLFSGGTEFFGWGDSSRDKPQAQAESSSKRPEEHSADFVPFSPPI